jgi:hypothetical protein
MQIAMKNLTQAEIIQHIKDGWELGLSMANNTPSYWLQKPALCCGGDSKKVNAGIARALYKKGLIKEAPRREKDRFWLTRYELGDKV